MTTLDPRVATYLKARGALLPVRCQPSLVAPAALAIVETRPLPHLPLVIATAIETHPTWPLYVFAPASVHEFLKPYVHNYTRAVLDAESMTVDDYSALLLSAEFWHVFQEPFVLLFQSDCVLVRPTPPRFFSFDCIGAVCGLLHPDHFIMNGGLSLRNVQAVQRALDLMPPMPTIQAEDIVLCNTMRAHARSFRLPSMRECDEFAIESQGDPTVAIGLHGTDKQYAPQALIENILSA
jgi:hypothetical protein